ncbi:hypothetical protein [Massilia sp. erpn]|nr:hypothetical protein [Massilia sp. erpn]
MYLLDTNVISEFRKGERAHPGVQRFFASVQSQLMFLPAHPRPEGLQSLQ